MTQTHYHVALILAVLLFVFVLIMNTLANTLPLNNQTTGAISFRYPNLFQPSGMTFSIWGIIYLSLGAWMVYQLFQWNLPMTENNQNIIYLLHAFSLSSIFNTLWLISWHYNKIMLSTLWMILLLLTLIACYLLLKNNVWFVKGSISLYLGWISVATIANIAIALVSIGVPSFDTLAIILTLLMIFIGLLLGLYMIFIQKDIIFGAVILWAYLGIWIRHHRLENISSPYPIITWFSLVSVIMLFLSLIFLFFQQLKA